MTDLHATKYRAESENYTWHAKAVSLSVGEKKQLIQIEAFTYKDKTLHRWAIHSDERDVSGGSIEAQCVPYECDARYTIQSNGALPKEITVVERRDGRSRLWPLQGGGGARSFVRAKHGPRVDIRRPFTLAMHTSTRQSRETRERWRKKNPELTWCRRGPRLKRVCPLCRKSAPFLSTRTLFCCRE